MKTFFTVLATLVCLNLMAQTTTPFEPVILIREFMKVADGERENYEKTEALWKKIHQRRVTEGKILGWTLYRRVAPQGSNAPYDYMVVTVFKSGKEIDDMNATMNWDYITKGLSVSDITLINDTEKTRKLVSSQWSRLTERVNPTGKYVEVTELTVPNGKGGELEKLEKLMNPIFTDISAAGKIAGWRFGEIMYNEGNAGGYFRVISTNSIHDMITWAENKTLENAFKKIYPTKDFEATMKSFGDIISFGKVDLWEKVDFTN
jgi:hypothetical protein